MSFNKVSVSGWINSVNVHGSTVFFDLCYNEFYKKGTETLKATTYIPCTMYKQSEAFIKMISELKETACLVEGMIASYQKDEKTVYSVQVNELKLLKKPFYNHNICLVEGYLGNDAECNIISESKSKISMSVGCTLWKGKDGNPDKTVWVRSGSFSDFIIKRFKEFHKGAHVMIQGKVTCQKKKVDDVWNQYFGVDINLISSIKKDENPNQESVLANAGSPPYATEVPASKLETVENATPEEEYDDLPF